MDENPGNITPEPIGIRSAMGANGNYSGSCGRIKCLR